MSNSIYRGFDIVPCIIGGTHNGFKWVDADGIEHGGFKTEDLAMDAIDKYKRASANRDHK